MHKQHKTKIYLIHIELSYTKGKRQKSKQVKKLLKEYGFIKTSAGGATWRLVKELNPGSTQSITAYLNSVFEKMEGIEFKIIPAFEIGNR